MFCINIHEVWVLNLSEIDKVWLQFISPMILISGYIPSRCVSPSINPAYVLYIAKTYVTNKSKSLDGKTVGSQSHRSNDCDFHPYYVSSDLGLIRIQILDLDILWIFSMSNPAYEWQALNPRGPCFVGDFKTVVIQIMG